MSGPLGGLALLGLAALFAWLWFTGQLNTAVTWIVGAFTAQPTPSTTSTTSTMSSARRGPVVA